jgi:hypothetical protein
MIASLNQQGALGDSMLGQTGKGPPGVLRSTGIEAREGKREKEYTTYI